MDSVMIVAAEEDESGVGEWLRLRLQDAGYRVWMDEYDLPAGVVINYGLDKAIREHDRVLLVLNQAALDSKRSTLQADMAVNAKEKITPVITDDAELTTYFGMRKAIKITGRNDWQALHRLVNDLGGGAIPRVVNLSGRTELQADGVLVLADLTFPPVVDGASLTRIAIDLGRQVTPYLTWDTGLDVGIVPPGFAPLAVALFAYLASRVNQLPRLFWPHALPAGPHQISAEVSVALQQSLRSVGIADRLAAAHTESD